MKTPKNKNVGVKKYAAAFLFSGVLLLAGAAAVCGRKAGLKETAAIAFYENEAMRTVDTPVTMAEFMLYAVDIKNGYDEAVGERFYEEIGTNAMGERESYENIVKEEIAESVRMVKALCSAALPEYGISLSEDEETILREQADRYHLSLVENGVVSDFLTPEIVRKYIREEYLSRKVYEHLKEKYLPKEQRVLNVGNEWAENTKSDTLSDELMEEIAGIVVKYDGAYSFQTHINWELMDAFCFSEPAAYPAESIDDAVSILSQKAAKEDSSEITAD